MSPWKWALILFSLLAIHQIRALHLDDRLYFWAKTVWYEDTWEARSLWLPEYRVSINAKVVGGVTDNFSGLSYDDDRQQIWAVVNNPEQLLLLDREGELLGRYPLSGFSDVEGVTYLGDGLLLLAEERNHALVMVQVPEKAGSLFREDYRALTLGIGLGATRASKGWAMTVRATACSWSRNIRRAGSTRSAA